MQESVHIRPIESMFGGVEEETFAEHGSYEDIISRDISNDARKSHDDDDDDDDDMSQLRQFPPVSPRGSMRNADNPSCGSNALMIRPHTVGIQKRPIPIDSHAPVDTRADEQLVSTRMEKPISSNDKQRVFNTALSRAMKVGPQLIHGRVYTAEGIRPRGPFLQHMPKGKAINQPSNRDQREKAVVPVIPALLPQLVASSAVVPTSSRQRANTALIGAPRI